MTPTRAGRKPVRRVGPPADLLGYLFRDSVREDALANFTVLSRLLMLAEDILEGQPGLFERLSKEIIRGSTATRMMMGGIPEMEMGWANATDSYRNIDFRLSTSIAAWAETQPEARGSDKSPTQLSNSNNELIRANPVSKKMDTSPMVTDHHDGGALRLTKAHNKRHRRDVVDPVIEAVQSTSVDPNDDAEIWGQLEKLAVDRSTIFTESAKSGLKYTENGQQKVFTRNALKKRLHPESRGASGKNKRKPSPT